MVMEKFGKALDNMIRRIRKLPRIDKDALNLVIQDLQRALLSADVNVEICLALTENIRTRAFNEKIADSIARKDFIIKLIHDELVTLLGGAHTPRKLKSNRLNILLMVGIQGSGKTTTVGKLAQYYRNNGFKLGVICVDTWRPGAYQQLQQLLDPLKIPLYGDLEEKNALKLAKKGIRYFANEKVDIIIVDTAGRHKEETALMNEVQKMEKMIKPDEVILVIDGSLGQQAFAQAKAFSEATHVGSIIVTKLDGSAKGGGALSAVAATGAPIKFIGVGEKTEALEDFVPTVFVGNLLGIPDIGGILQKIKEAEIEPDKDMVKRLMKGKFTLDDLYQQLESLKRMGPFKKLLSMMGGQNIPDEMKDMAESNLENWKIVLTSMTQYEKENPQVIKKTRIERIAKGSGKSYSDIKGLLKQYDDMKKMISQLTKPRRGKKGLPGMPPGMPDLSKLGM